MLKQPVAYPPQSHDFNPMEMRFRGNANKDGKNTFCFL